MGAISPSSRRLATHPRRTYKLIFFDVSVKEKFAIVCKNYVKPSDLPREIYRAHISPQIRTLPVRGKT